MNGMPLTMNILNYPYGYSLLTREIAPLQISLVLPFALMGESSLGYNISIMSTFFLVGLTMFFWVYAITELWQTLIISETAFVFLPSDLFLYFGSSLNNFPDLKSIETLQGEQITYIVIDENEITDTDAILIAAVDIGLKYEGSFYGQSMSVIEY